MNAKVSIHNITSVSIEQEVFERSSESLGFTVVNITATDDTGQKTRLACFMEPGVYVCATNSSTSSGLPATIRGRSGMTA
jgi:hypothetical protein